MSSWNIIPFLKDMIVSWQKYGIDPTVPVTNIYLQYKKFWPILCTYRQCQLYKNYHLSDSNSEMSPIGRCIPSLKMLKYEIYVLETMKYSPVHRREYTCSPVWFGGFSLYFCHFCQKRHLLTVHTDYTLYSWFYL